MLGTGWRCLDIIHLLEEDLQVPVVHAVPARVWTVQKRLHVRQRVKGFGRLLEEMP
jgi:maleate cis-trans isomerase